MNKKQIGLSEIAFDIETIGDETALAQLPPVEADPRLKDPSKIQANIEKKTADQKAKLGLNPFTCRIACLSWKSRDDSGAFLLDQVEAEKEMLEQAWEQLGMANFFITFNGNNFDVPVIRARSLILGVSPQADISTKKYSIGNHADIRAILTNWDTFAKGTMGFFVLRLLGRKLVTAPGSEVQGQWDRGEKDLIRQHCDEDVAELWDLYEYVLNSGCYNL